MNQYGVAGTQQDESSGLMNNPRYQGQSGGTVPMGHDGRGPQQETRYGAAPLSTGNTTDPVETIRNPAAYGFKKNEPEGFRFPGTTGSQQQQPGMVEPNARPSQAGYGTQPPAGYGNEPEFAKEQPSYGERGFGAPSEGQNTGSLWPQPATPPNAHKTDLVGQSYGGNQAGDQAGYGGNQAGYGENQAAGYDQPRRHAHGQEFNPNVNHPSEERGFGGGLGAQGYDQSQQLGDGYHNRMATGADAYGQPQTGGEGYNARTATGNDAYVHGNHPPGMQDRVEGVNEPSLLGGEREGMRERMPQATLGERRTEPGYDMSKGHHHLPGQGEHQQKLDGTGFGGQSDTGLDGNRLDDERRGKQFEDTTGTDSYDGTGTGSDDATATGTAPPKKGLMTKIKEKLHH